ncbi:MAG: hypothetical protein Q8N51_04715, partial [Gammaproteobacteria bacterium]|nr:hypothetical protein [Gammaproteobacteria bacterium]
KEPSSPRTEVFDGVVIQDRDPSVDDAEAIFVVDFMADAWFGRVRILIDMTAVARTLVCAWINGRWPSRRSAIGRTRPLLRQAAPGRRLMLSSCSRLIL